MVLNYSTYEGEPPRMYRSVGDIGRDINIIKERISEANSRLNIRQMLDAAMGDIPTDEPSRLIGELSRIVTEAEETLEDLARLNESLDGLSREMEDTLWVLGRS
ncbi:MAG: hypothetical protein IJX38_06435 [Clostridia bacterium]|nr:hypothetical protein [Clostridia bacterium]